jgi:hypothetical protein
MQIGDINVIALNIGDIDLNSYVQATYEGFNIYEDILNPYGPTCEIKVIDHSDALGGTNLNGNYEKDIEISFSLSGQSSENFVGFKFKQYQNKNLDDSASKRQGSLNSKTYNVRGVSMELLNAPGNYVSRSYNDLTSTMVRDVVMLNFKSDKEFQIIENTKGKRGLYFSNEHPIAVLKKLNSEHVAETSQSSCFALFQQQNNGVQKYIFTTYEQLFQQTPVAYLAQSTTLNFSDATAQDKQNAILHFVVSDSFFTPARSMARASEQTVNLTTHGVVSTKPVSLDFKLIDQPTYTGNKQTDTEYPVKRIIDKVNEPQRHSSGDAHKKRAAFLSHLMQNSAELEIPGNPAIKLGDIVNLKIPNKSDTGDGKGAGETQFNGNALVVGIRHKIKPASLTPRYTMLLRVVKASYKDPESGNA